ncbi:MAG TPA: AarF/ABC1/UbiB kinase family protein, partial [Polyangiaceae bacterium]|nr:AarF/ABC1/UbiB kinase family protein [Polyangiaceae bacterium]
MWATSVFVPTFAVVWLCAGSLAPAYLRWYLEWCGGGFAKLGQLLAMRYDFLPPRYHTELGKILDRMPAFPFNKAKRIIEAEFGCAVEQHFSEVEEAPLGAASIAQVHGAVLKDGRSVVLKVMRPGVRGKMRADHRSLLFWAQILEKFGVFKGADLDGMVKEVWRLIQEELDFTREALNAERFSQALATDAINHYAPRPLFELCGERVLTLERLWGVPLTEVVSAISVKNHRQLAIWATRGIHAASLGRILFRSMLEQFYRHRIFHGDPHAGNLIAMEGGRLGYVDFGNVGQLDERLWARQEAIVSNLVGGKVHAAYNSLLGTLEPLNTFNLTKLESEVTTLYDDYLMKVASPNAKLSERTMGDLFLRIADAIRRAGLKLPLGLTRFYRAQLLFDVVAFQLCPELNIAAEYGRFMRDERQRRLATALLQFAERPDRCLEFVVERVPQLVNAVSEWILFKLPRAEHSYDRVMSRFERAIHLSLRYLRRFLLAF